MKAAAVWAGEVLIWAALLVGIWVVTLSSVATSEMAAAAGSGVLCGVAAAGARRAANGHWRPRVGWWRWLAPLPAAIVVDTGRVWAAAWRQVRHPEPSPGRLTQVHLDTDPDEATAAARAALAGIAVSVTPSTFVVDVDPEDRTMVVHALTEGRPSMVEAVSP